MRPAVHFVAARRTAIGRLRGSLSSVRELRLDPGLVNPDGGAIARIPTTLLHRMHRMHRMHRTGARRGLATMCVGVGQGSAVLVDRD
jgi:acetyl-CoA acyltransferase